MTAGAGVSHSEANASKSELVHFLQIWLLPGGRGLTPGYEQKTFSRQEKLGRLRLVGSPDGRDGSVTLHADASLYAGVFELGAQAEVALAKDRFAWVHVARGEARVNGKPLRAGDGAALSDERTIEIEGVDAAEVLAFDLA
jgi:quercetin 2,3-dioxygenase